MGSDNQELLKKIEEGNYIDSSLHSKSESEKNRSFVIVQIDTRKFAFPSETVLEIFLTDTVYYIPFCPGYVTGFINRYGEPYTVIDLLALEEDRKQDNKRFIILKSDEDQLAFMVEDVLDIFPIASDSIVPLELESHTSDYLVGSFEFNGDTIWIVDSFKILERLETDLD